MLATMTENGDNEWFVDNTDELLKSFWRRRHKYYIGEIKNSLNTLIFGSWKIGKLVLVQPFDVTCFWKVRLRQRSSYHFGESLIRFSYLKVILKSFLRSRFISCRGNRTFIKIKRFPKIRKIQKFFVGCGKLKFRRRWWMTDCLKTCPLKFRPRRPRPLTHFWKNIDIQEMGTVQKPISGRDHWSFSKYNDVTQYRRISRDVTIISYMYIQNTCMQFMNYNAYDMQHIICHRVQIRVRRIRWASKFISRLRIRENLIEPKFDYKNVCCWMSI